MILLPHLAGRIFNTPLLITEQKLSEILWALGDRLGLDESILKENLEMRPSLDSRRRSINPTIEDGVGIVPVHGTLIHRSMRLDPLSGLTSYGDIQSNFTSMLESKEAEAILFDIDSQGGEASGLFDLIDLIYRSRGQKPIVAAINDMALSAAYGLASTADKVFISRTGKGGSIGVIALHIDQSAKDAKDGLKYTAVYAGKRKNDFNPHNPLSEEAIADATIKINTIYDLFTSTVARNNGLEVEEIIKQEAAVYMGQDAVKAGLADQVMSYEEAFQYTKTLIGGKKSMADRNAQVAQTQGEGIQVQTQGQEVNPQEQVISQPVQTPSVQAQAQTIQTPPVQTQSVSIEMLRAEILKTERARIEEINNLCAGMNVQELAGHFIKEGYSVENAKLAIQNTLAKESELTAIRSQHVGFNQPAKNPLIEDANARAAAFNQRGPLV